FSSSSKQTKYGDWYDCVDFYEQPAFDHPLLRDHKYEYKMSPSIDLMSESDTVLFDIWLNKKGCPTNTVPIKRVTKEELIQINKITEVAHTTNENPGVQVAVAKLASKLYGGGTTASIYHPTVQNNQYSSSRLKVENGLDSIAVGWTVNPTLYPDNETHLFVYTATKDSQCYNTYCPGFIRMSSVVPPDLKLKLYPITGVSFYEIPMFVFKTNKTGDWYFNVGSRNFTVGTWPQRIFTGLADSISNIEWGGEVYSPPGTTPPPMGSGHLPGDNIFYDSFCSSIRIVNENLQLDINPDGLELYQSSSTYQVKDVGIYSPHEQRTILYGGAYGQ
ncbi:hypothetical protein LINPERPRIM_LOCUS11674, partial [Linum perenne]